MLILLGQNSVKLIGGVLFGIAEQLAKDLELFSQHAGRKSANMEDVILSGELSEPYVSYACPLLSNCMMCTLSQKLLSARLTLHDFLCCRKS